MLQSILRCYERFRLSTYRSMFGLLRERDGSLSATEAFSVDVIHLLQGPTIKEFADCLGISQPNATYKVNQLIQKGYVEKIPSLEDRRETHLQVTDRYIRYSDRGSENLIRALETLKTQFTPQEMETFSRVIRALSDAIDQDNA
jgi:DNA-binding MarR family transcriptional regulator